MNNLGIFTRKNVSDSLQNEYGRIFHRHQFSLAISPPRVIKQPAEIPSLLCGVDTAGKIAQNRCISAWNFILLSQIRCILA